VEGLKAHGHRDAHTITRETVAAAVAERAEAGDVIICLGAGDITAWAYALPDELKALG
jgi:UDP-N-acetylmuramate--alanine ligase